MSYGQDTRASSAVGWWLVLLQFFFAITWTVYVLYLPQLFQQAHLPKTWLLPVLMADQVIFAIADLVVGAAADRARAMMRRFSRWIVIATAVSCAAFVALPFVAPRVELGAPALLALIFMWAVTSAALRVPPIALLGRHLAQPSAAWLAGLVALGMGLAALIGPYLTVHLRDLDPRLPFVLSSATLLVTVLVFLAVERRSGPQTPEVQAVANLRIAPIARRAAIFVVAILVLAFGFQIHTSLTSPRVFLHFVATTQLPALLSVFWVGFNLAVLPAGRLTARFGGLRVTAAAALIGAVAICVTLVASGLVTVIVAQGLVGAAWSAVVVSAFASALLIGGDDGSGRVVGLTFASFAVATFGRMAITTAGLSADDAVLWSPVVVWIGAGLVLAILAAMLHLHWPQPRPAPS